MFSNRERDAPGTRDPIPKTSGVAVAVLVVVATIVGSLVASTAGPAHGIDGPAHSDQVIAVANTALNEAHL